jgi:gas vesicle protein
MMKNQKAFLGGSLIGGLVAGAAVGLVSTFAKDYWQNQQLKKKIDEYGEGNCACSCPDTSLDDDIEE